MTRQEFTKNIIILLQEMKTAGESPVIDYTLRGSIEQLHLFLMGASRCDGVSKKSNHQSGIAMDIYLTDVNGEIRFSWDLSKANLWHKRWVEMGGKPMITFKNGTIDAGHFD